MPKSKTKSEMTFLKINNLDIEYQTRKETIYASKRCFIYTKERSNNRYSW